MNRKSLIVGFTYNQKLPGLEHLDKYHEWDSPDTIEGITKALEITGNHVVHLEADKNIYHKLERYRNDLSIVFNIAECLSQDLFDSENREAAVPMFLDFLQIPYTGSGPSALVNALDKATTKEILSYYGVRTPLFERIDDYTDRLKKAIPFPAMVKPVSEGTSIGITQGSRVEDEEELYRTIKRVIRAYEQPALVEEFVDGTEYTVGIVGDLVLPILQIDLRKLPGQPFVRDAHIKDIEPDYTNISGTSDSAMTLAPFNKRYVALATQSVVAHNALGCRDYNRMDIRAKRSDGRTYFLEMNPLPGMHPTEGDLPVMAKAAGIEYNILVNMILYDAIKRYKPDKRYRERFSNGHVGDIVDLVDSTRKRLANYDISVESNGSSYPLVLPAFQG